MWFAQEAPSRKLSTVWIQQIERHGPRRRNVNWVYSSDNLSSLVEDGTRLHANLPPISDGKSKIVTSSEFWATDSTRSRLIGISPSQRVRPWRSVTIMQYQKNQHNLVQNAILTNPTSVRRIRCLLNFLPSSWRPWFGLMRRPFRQSGSGLNVCPMIRNLLTVFVISTLKASAEPLNFFVYDLPEFLNRGIREMKFGLRLRPSFFLKA